MRHLAGLRMGYAVLYSSGTRTNTHYNLQLGGETAIMVKDRFVSAYAEPEYTIARRRLRRRDPAVRLRPEPPRPLGRRRCRSTRTRTWSRRRSTSATASCSSAGSTRRLLADPLSMWRTWVNRTLDRGHERLGDIPEPVRGLLDGCLPAPEQLEASASPAGVACRRLRSTRTVLDVGRGASGLQPGCPRDGRVDALGRPGQHLRPRRARVRPGRRGTTSASSPGWRRCKSGAITPEQFLDLNANVGSWKALEGHGSGGLPVRARRVHLGRRETSTSGAHAT